MKNIFTKSILVCLMMTSILACQKDNQPSVTSAAGKKTALDVLKLSSAARTGSSIDLTLTAGATGAPAGFSLHWMKKVDFDVYGWALADSAASFCSAGFSGVPGCSNYNMAANGTVTITIGDNLFDECGVSSSCSNVALECGTEYVFRAFAHNNPGKGGLGRSEWSSDLTASPLACVTTACTYGQGYWKNHGIVTPGNQDYTWPQSVKDGGMMLGTTSYNATELLAIFNAEPKGGNDLVILAHQLIAAKLNVANGVNGSSIASTIESADALIGSLVAPPKGTGFLKSNSLTIVSDALEAFNRSSGCKDDE